MTKTVNQPPRVPGTQLPIERARDISFAKKLQQLMAERDLSQSDIAAEIWGKYVNTEGKRVARGRDRLSVWARGKSFPDRRNLEKLARVLKVKVSELAPEAVMKAAHHGSADWSVTQPHGAGGQVFIQVAQYVPRDIAHEIMALLLKVDAELIE